MAIFPTPTVPETAVVWAWKCETSPTGTVYITIPEKKLAIGWKA